MGRRTSPNEQHRRQHPSGAAAFAGQTARSPPTPRPSQVCRLTSARRRRPGATAPSLDQIGRPMPVRTARDRPRPRRTASPPMRPAPPQPSGGAPAQAAPPQKAAAPQVQQPRPQPPAAQQQPATAAPSRRTRTIRRAKLRLVRVDPWSVTKVVVPAVDRLRHHVRGRGVLGVLDHERPACGTTSTRRCRDHRPDDQRVRHQRLRRDEPGHGHHDAVAAVDVVLITALATLGAFIYNMAASLLGGVEVTLAEDIK